jgi:arylsulfatase A-like enzyme
MAYQFLKFAATGNQAVGGVLQTNKEALKWIDDVTRGDAPFFCFVNYMEAHPPLLEGILRVPLVVRYPKVFPAGMRVAEPVQTVDILPTLLDILGLHEPRFEAQFQGRLLPPLESSGRAMPVIAEEMRPLLELRFVKALRPNFDVAQRYDRVHRALISGWAKYIWSSDGNHELYDLFSDPQENRNIYTSRRREAMRLEERLRAWLSTFTPYDTASAGYTFQPPDRQTREQLKSLGYIQ